MSIFESRPGISDDSDVAAPASSIAQDAMLRAIGALVLLGIGAMHFLQLVQTFQATPLLGVAYLVLITACITVAGCLVTRGDRRSWAAAAIVGAAAIGGYLLTRLISTPLDNQDVGNWSCMLGLAALFVESTLMAFSGYALAEKRSRPTKATSRPPGTPGRATLARQLSIVSAALILAGGYVHFCLYRHGYRAIPEIGVSFLLQATSSVILAGALLVPRGRIRLGRHSVTLAAATRLAAIGLSVSTLAALGLAHTGGGLFQFHEIGLQPAPQTIIAITAESLAALLLAAALLEARAAQRSQRVAAAVAYPSGNGIRDAA